MPETKTMSTDKAQGQAQGQADKAGQVEQTGQATAESQESSDLLANYKFQRGGNWSQENVITILQWIHISSINLDVMTEAAYHYKKLIRMNTILSLLMSTITSTASFTQFNISEDSYPGLSTGIKVLITALATFIALSSGFLKIYQIQEKLEKAIKLQQEWTSFGSILSNELQLPTYLRKDALYLIVKYKDIYTELFKQQVDISRKIIARVARKNDLEPNDLTLSELFERIIYSEADRLTLNMEGNYIMNSTRFLTENKQQQEKQQQKQDQQIQTLTQEEIHRYYMEMYERLAIEERERQLARQSQPMAKQSEPMARNSEPMMKESPSMTRQSQPMVREINEDVIKDKATLINEALKEIIENKSVGQEASNVLENKVITNDGVDDKSVISMAGVIIQKPSQQSSEVMSKKTSFIQSTVMINAKDKLKTIISPKSVNNNPQQEQNRKRISNLVVNSSTKRK